MLKLAIVSAFIVLPIASADNAMRADVDARLVG